MAESGAPAVVLINHNGALYPASQPLLTADNRGFRYGDGLFETMLVEKGRIRLSEYHFDRLLAGMSLLYFNIPPSFKEKLQQEMLQLCDKNGHFATGPARVRLVIFRGEGSLLEGLDPFPNYIIQSWQLSAIQSFNTEGLKLGVFPDGRKALGILSNIKSNNYLLYTLAMNYAQRQGLDDCLVLNDQGRLADSTIANLFYIRKGEFYTPPLSEGGVAGIMRRHLLEVLPQAGYAVHEQTTAIEDLLAADEIFMTNALRGIRWVRSLQGRIYSNDQSAAVYEQLVKRI